MLRRVLAEVAKVTHGRHSEVWQELYPEHITAGDGSVLVKQVRLHTDLGEGA